MARKIKGTSLTSLDPTKLPRFKPKRGLGKTPLVPKGRGSNARGKLVRGFPQVDPKFFGSSPLSQFKV
jgi:hypothetical protein